MKTITGNLLEIRHGTILHQVNCRGVTGGLAGALQRQYPAAFTNYFALCTKYDEADNFGRVDEWHASLTLSILHLFGQNFPGANTEMPRVRKALEKLILLPLREPIYAPYLMGCGLGGGDWNEYLPALTAVFPDIIIVQRPEDTYR